MEVICAVPVFPGEVVSSRCLGIGLNVFVTALCAQVQEVLYWDCKVFKASAVAPLGLPVLFSKASVAMQDETQTRLLKENLNKIKPHLRVTEISPSVT